MKKILISVVFAFASFCASAQGGGKTPGNAVFRTQETEIADSPDAALRKSADRANRRTALRCLEAATTYAARENWNAAVSQSRLGLSYDEEISDLWYIWAVSLEKNGGKRGDILPLVRTAIEKSNWVNYNRDNARILYADLLSDMGQSEEVFAVLDSNPPVFSSDAEYIRAKAYYRMPGSAARANARNKISSARRIFPDDTRFPLLFFKYEDVGSSEDSVRALVSAFVPQIVDYAEAVPDRNAELELYAACFADDSYRKKILESFSARGLVHPMYARIALQAGLMGEKEAFEYIASFADDSLDYEYIADFMPLIKDESVKAEAREYFTAYGGTLTRDTTGDGIPDLLVSYYRGRPQSISFDGNQDGYPEWDVACDFGVPISGILHDANALDAKDAEFSWRGFPCLSSFALKDADGKIVNTFELVDEELVWTPVRIEQDARISSSCDVQFFFPVLNVTERNMTFEELVKASASFTLPTKERENAYIRVMALHGQLQVANYYSNGVFYAHATFNDNLPAMRLVDSDGDGVFETTEYYDVIPIDEMYIHSEEDERTITTNLFGTPSVGADFYLRMVQVDRNGDTIPDFTEEYVANGGSVSSWDSDGDGNWNIRTSVYRSADGLVKTQEDLFFDDATNSVIKVVSSNGVPSVVSVGNKTLPVSKDEKEEIYWLGEKGSPEIALLASEYFATHTAQGLSTILVGKDGEKMLAVHIGEYVYGKVIPETTYDTNGNNDEKTE